MLHSILNNQTIALTLFPAVQLITGIVVLWLVKRDNSAAYPTTPSHSADTEGKAT